VSVLIEVSILTMLVQCVHRLTKAHARGQIKKYFYGFLVYGFFIVVNSAHSDIFKYKEPLPRKSILI